jgi:hypothetical protein
MYLSTLRPQRLEVEATVSPSSFQSTTYVSMQHLRGESIYDSAKPHSGPIL